MSATVPISHETVAAPLRPRPPAHARVAVLGASGYAGQEFARLAATHEGITLVALASREHAGRPAAEMLPGLDPRNGHWPQVCAPDSLAELAREGAFDTLVVALPHGAWRQLADAEPDLASLPLRVLDLSSDHRDGTHGYRYGLPEMARDAIAPATRVANPGCYPTAATLALLPIAERRLFAGPISITALSGVSGAGRSPNLRTSFVELEGGAAIYRAGTAHPHVAEMERNLHTIATTAHESGLAASRTAGARGAPPGRPTAATRLPRIPIGFVPQLAPMARGILLSATAPLATLVTPDDVHALYVRRFANETFVRVLDPGQWPETRLVRGSNRCDLAVSTLHDGRTLLVTAAIDNLVKGAAGQALQNLNLMLGWPEDWALPVHGTPW
ncbi:MAG: N-acetyl-gamma-glutamyl-phosphate reductase [Candidatus Eisenbacteria bacterium]|uniref:N-acetyl-gamma-glutamyl-phosphate reductase n=1 Tax=Eiseniibacteriota bacterium TaxID=2212470 RepID=A0A849SLD1_UNCEI|nr:N-acetyl-gamma-glutamyl-phosphate reductase [Candidatus Eisenbacteria bacterium]